MPDIILKRNAVVEQNISYTPPQSGVYSKPIQLDPDNLYPMSLIYVGDEQTGAPLVAKNLADISSIFDVNGAPTGTPANNGLGITQWDYYKQEWYNVKSFDLHIDLGGLYDLDYAFVWIPASAENQRLRLSTSRNGTDYVQVAETAPGTIAQGTWIKIPFNNPEAQGAIRYFTIGMLYPQSYIKGFVLYGRRRSVDVNRGIKKRRNIGPRSYDKVIGTNGFYFEQPEMLSKVAGLGRWYNQPDWWVGEAFRNVGSAYNHTVDEFTFRFDNSHMGSLDQQLQAYKNYGTKSMFTPTQSPQALRPIGTANPGLSKPINPGLSTINLTATTNPANYSFISRMYWNIAARYGSNVNVDLQFVQLDQTVAQPVRVGLGIMEALEVGNEYDAWWNGEAAYFSPEEMAAYMSAIFDGHMKTMGDGFGAKNADPSIRVVMVALALSDNITYVKRMIWWWDKHRGKGNYPIDVLNFHYYNSTGGSQLETDGTGIHGLQPEKGDLIKTCDLWTNFRDRYLPSCEIWCSETGYDEHLGGKLSPLRNTAVERAKMKSYWLGRLFVVMQMHGMDAIQHYWYSNHSYPWFQDQKEDEPNPASFMSSGLVDGNYPEDYNNRYPLMAYYYVATYKHILTGYTFSHSVIEEGVYKIEQEIFVGDISTLWAACYKNYRTGETLLLVWLSSDDFVSKSIDIKILENNTTLINVDDAETRNIYEGVTVPLTKIANVVNVTVNECIKFIKTVTVGTPKLLQPTKVQVQKIAGGSLITWIDSNLKDTLIRISRSTSPTTGFNLLVEGIYNSASYFDESAGNTIYYYKVQAIRNNTPVDPDEPEIPTTPPVFTNPAIAYNQSFVNATGDYSSPTNTPENVNLREYVWYGGGEDANTASSNFVRINSLDNLSSWSKSTFIELLKDHIWFKVKVRCVDVNGIAFEITSPTVKVSEPIPDVIIGQRISGQIPVDVPLDLTSLQAPPTPAINMLFDGVDTRPEDFYGAMFPEFDTIQTFPDGQLPIIQQIQYGNHQGDHSAVGMRIYGINDNDTEELISTYSTVGLYNIANPKIYKALRYNVRANARPNFVKLFGTYIPVVKEPVVYTKYPVGNQLGINAHPYSFLENVTNINIRHTIYDKAHDIIKRLKRVRIYINNDNINNVENVFAFESDRQGYNIHALITELYYGRSTESMTAANLINNPIQYQSNGLPVGHVHLVYCMQSTTSYINASYPNQDNYERLPIRYGADRYDPASWAEWAEIGFQIALRYGTNPNNIPATASKSKEGPMWNGAPEPYVFHKYVGLGTLKEIEVYNEMDKWWKGIESYADGKTFAVALHTIYTRIKEADPNMQVTFPGIATYFPDVIKDFERHCMTMYGFIPVDNYAVHFYPNTGGTQYSPGDNRGMVIELSQAPRLAVEFREANFYKLGNKPIDIGEIGFDSNVGSPLRAVPPTGSTLTQREWAAVLYVRTALFMAEVGIRSTYTYEWSDGSASPWDQFAKMGFTYVIENNPREIGFYPNYNCYVQLMSLLEFAVLNQKLGTDPVILNKYINSNNNSIIYALYLKTEVNATANYNINMPGFSSVTVHTLSMTGFTTIQTTVNLTNGAGSLTINEIPKFLIFNV